MTKKDTISKAIERFKSNKNLNSNDLKLINKIKNEAESFIERNSLSQEHKEAYCPRCLKAYLTNLAYQMNAENKIIVSLTESIPDETGHNGYYLDKNTLRPIKLNLNS